MQSDTGLGQTSSAGWKCASCGAWVGIRTPHYCPNPQPTTFDFTAGDATLYQKLDNIAELLGRIVRKIGA